jgi:hypothetical protein
MRLSSCRWRWMRQTQRPCLSWQKMVSIEAPRTQVAALKLKKLLGNLGKPAYDISIHVLSDLMSETAKKTFGMKP